MTARRHLLVSLLSGTAVAAGVAWIVPVEYWLLIGWDVACLVYLTTVWMEIWPRSAHETARLAEYTDPTRAAADAIALSAAVASLGAVAVVLMSAHRSPGPGEISRIVFALVSIVLSWAVVHTLFTLRYAHLYYDGVDGGVDFNGDQPRYSDLAYLSFTIGMTFQVSDTALQTNLIRRTALMHGLLSYLFGTGILAITINLVASLGSSFASGG
jgi:uncharacterized membrane protein